MAQPAKRIPWSTWMSRALKGVGAALAVLSLISGVRSLSALWLEYRDDSAALQSSLEAANLMAETQEFELAWDQLDRAAHVVTEPELLPYRIGVAMQWVQWLGTVPTSQADYEATIDRVLPYLYRGLADPGDVDAIDLQAHVAWAVYLGGVDNARAADEAVAMLQDVKDSDNLYVRTLLGFFEAFNGYEAFEDVVAHFDAAPPTNGDAWASGLQLATFGNLFETRFMFGRDNDALFLIAQRALPLAAHHPENDAFSSQMTSWLYSLNRSEQVGLIEELVEVVEPGAFLAVLDVAYSRSAVYGVTRYLYARLEEERGDLDAARAHLGEFDEGWSRTAQPALLGLVQDAQARLGVPVTIKPESGRDFISDELPPDVEPWRFHLDSLLNASFMFRGDNLLEAGYFFEELSPQEVNSDIRAGLVTARDRLKEYVDEGEQWLL